jgi:hypothetical protein
MPQSQSSSFKIARSKKWQRKTVLKNTRQQQQLSDWPARVFTHVHSACQSYVLQAELTGFLQSNSPNDWPASCTTHVSFAFQSSTVQAERNSKLPKSRQCALPSQHLTCNYSSTELFGLFWTLSIIWYVEVLHKTTKFRRLDLSLSSGGWGRVALLSWAHQKELISITGQVSETLWSFVKLPHTRRWTESKRSQIVLTTYNTIRILLSPNVVLLNNLVNNAFWCHSNSFILST